MEFENVIRGYQYPVKQLLVKTIRHRMPYTYDEFPLAIAPEETIVKFILKYKDAIINDYKEIAQVRKNKKTDDIEKHWRIKIVTENVNVKNKNIDEFNKILAGQTISRIIVKALAFYYPEKIIIKKRVDNNINNVNGKVRICAIAVEDELMEDIRKLIEEIKALQWIPLLIDKAITHSKRTGPKKVGRPSD